MGGLLYVNDGIILLLARILTTSVAIYHKWMLRHYRLLQSKISKFDNKIEDNKQYNKSRSSLQCCLFVLVLNHFTF